jgi:L,D-peptidoglycan transpeptidase YkuD (ErfK/YbiS/YcfS/YnhG family)
MRPPGSLLLLPVVLLLLLAPATALPAYAVEAGPSSPGLSAIETTPSWTEGLPADTTQVVRTISSTRYCSQVYCTVTQAWTRGKDGGWRRVRQFRSVIGPRGWGKTHEGDMRSPVGIFRIAVTFSTGPRNPGHMPWRRRTATTIVSSVNGPDYNTWITVPGATSGNRPSMRFGWVLDYNHVRLTPGVGPRPVPHKGSGIFYHTSKPGHPWSPTDGCTQLGIPAQMRWLEAWLRPAADPRVVQDR